MFLTSPEPPAKNPTQTADSKPKYHSACAIWEYLFYCMGCGAVNVAGPDGVGPGQIVDRPGRSWTV
jgi:hypothetical protein